MGLKQLAKRAKIHGEREPWRRGQRLWLHLNLSLWLHGGQVRRLEGSRCLALPHTASSIRMTLFIMLKASSLIAWVLDQSLWLRATSVILISCTKGTPWPGLTGPVFSFLTRNQESGFRVQGGWGVRQANRDAEGWGGQASPPT